MAASARQNNPNAANPTATTTSKDVPGAVPLSVRSAASSPPALAGLADSAAVPARTPITPRASAREVPGRPDDLDRLPGGGAEVPHVEVAHESPPHPRVGHGARGHQDRAAAEPQQDRPAGGARTPAATDCAVVPPVEPTSSR